MIKGSLNHPSAIQQRGFSLIAAIFVVVILGAIGTFIVAVSTAQKATTTTTIKASRAYEAARSGIEWGIYRAVQDVSCLAATNIDVSAAPGLGEFNAVQVTCTFTNHTEGNTPIRVYLITSTATSGAFGEPYFVSRQIRVSATNAPDRNEASEEAKRLIEQYCASNDEDAFRVFYRSQADRLWRYLVARGCGTEDAYDVLSETFLKFSQTVCKDPRSPVALLFRIATNQNIDRYRREKASPVETTDDSNSLDFAVEGAPEDHDTVRRLTKKLPEREQNLLLMRYWIGLTHRELAEVLDLPEGTVRRQCAQVIKNLRERWEQE